MKHYLWLLIIFIIYFPIVIQGKDDIPDDNLTIFDRLTEQILDQALTNVDLEQYSKVLIKSTDPENKNNWYFENRLIKVLNKIDFNSITLYREEFYKDTITVNNSTPTLVFEFKIIHLDVKYLSENNFWKNKLIERHIKVGLWINIYGYSDGLVYWAGNIGKNHSDNIKADQITTLQNPNIIFTQAANPPLPGFKKFFEPIFIMGLTGLTIYLFYSFRSK